MIYSREPKPFKPQRVDGGEGNNVDISLKVKAKFGVTDVDFTNVPMHLVHAAIAVLNGDTDFGTIERGNITAAEPGEFKRFDSRNPKAEVNYLYGKDTDGNPSAYADTDSMRTKNFTKEELFQQGIIMTNQCAECGAYVANRDKHVTWHNKTLP